MSGRVMLVRWLVILGIASLMFLAGCGGSTSQSANNQPPPPSQPTAVTVSPSSATVTASGVQQFTAIVNPSGANQAVTWSLSGTGCTGASCGTIDSTGRYTAPATIPNPPAVMVTATSVADPTKAATASVAIMTPGSNPVPTINGLSPSVTAVGGSAFTLAVVGSNFVASSAVRWNGSDRPTAFVNSDEIHAQISASDIAVTGTAAITVFNPAPGGGTSNSVTFSVITGVGPVSVAVAPDPSGKFGKFAYVANSTSNNVSMYMINPTTGALAFIGTIAAGTTPQSVAVNPSGKFAYVANAGSNDISMYIIDASTGALTSTGTIAAGTAPQSVALNPSGRFAYVANAGSNNISMYNIDATTGALTSTGTVAAGTRPVSVTVDPSGKFSYVANCGDFTGGGGGVSMYTINTTTGTLTFTGTIDSRYCPFSVAVHPSAKFAYVVIAGDIDLHVEGVSLYTIDATSGTLTSVRLIDEGLNPTSIAIDPSGKFGYVTNNLSNDVSMYTIDPTTGALMLIGTIGT